MLTEEQTQLEKVFASIVIIVKYKFSAQIEQFCMYKTGIIAKYISILLVIY